MTQEAKSAAAAAKNAPTCRQVRQSLEHGNGPVFSSTRPPFSSCSRANMRRPSPPSKSCCPRRHPRSWNAAGCTSAPASPRLDSTSLAFLTPGERYDYAISQTQCQGYFEEAREQLKGILARTIPTPTTPFTGWRCWTPSPGKPQDCLDNLAQAIELNPKNRLQARVRQRLSEHGRRSSLYGVAVS